MPKTKAKTEPKNAEALEARYNLFKMARGMIDPHMKKGSTSNLIVAGMVGVAAAAVGVMIFMSMTEDMPPKDSSGS
jgi:hypothetical protein